MRKILVIDPNCRNSSGHYYSTSRSLLNALPAARKFIAVHRRAEDGLEFGDGVTVWRWPDDRTLAGRIFRSVRKSRRYRQGWPARNVGIVLELIARAGLGAQDVVIVHSSHSQLSQAMADAYRALPPASRPELHLRHIWSEPSSGDPDFTPAHEALAALSDSSGIHVYAETVEMLAFMTASYPYASVRQWPLPMVIDPSAPREEKSDPAECFVIGMLGSKRREQGAGQIAPIVRALLDRGCRPASARMRILLQLPSGSSSPRKRREEARRFVASLPDPAPESGVQLEFLDPILSTGDFRKAIHCSHVLLLPYEQESYGMRGSGLIIEGALSGTPVVVTHGFAMANWLDLAGSPRASDPAGYAEALRSVARDYPQYRAGALRAGEAVRQMITERLEDIRGGEF
ncbi:MAG: glycosyltransferase [Akkermansiaceae bacterium]|nr:glycosyltransferase [Akkermansiaceae bacterium]